MLGSGRIHHPKRAARLGTPVRSRFCNESPTLRNGGNRVRLHHLKSAWLDNNLRIIRIGRALKRE